MSVNLKYITLFYISQSILCLRIIDFHGNTKPRMLFIQTQSDPLGCQLVGENLNTKMKVPMA